MSRLFYHVCQDNAGNLLFDVSGTMRLAGSGTLATIYGDEALTVILPNPMTNHPSFGSFKCFLPNGDFDFYMAKPGYTFETLTGVQGYGTMAQQDASAVAITGGAAKLTQAALGTGLITAGFDLVAGTGNIYLGGRMGFAVNPPVAKIDMFYTRASENAINIKTNGDTGGGSAVAFLNTAGAVVGTITTDGAATAYNTTSDSRLKTAVQNLVGELAVIRALRPVRFRWLADNAEGVGFLASEVAEHVQGVVTGEPDAVDENGSIRPQQIDHSKLVPWLVGALQALAGQVETLAERVQELEAGLGV